MFYYLQFEPTEKSVEAEKSANLALINQLGKGRGSSKKAKHDAEGDGRDVLNVRKAVRFASGGEGAISLARKSAPTGDSRQKRKSKR